MRSVVQALLEPFPVHYNETAPKGTKSDANCPRILYPQAGALWTLCVSCINKKLGGRMFVKYGLAKITTQM